MIAFAGAGRGGPGMSAHAPFCAETLRASRREATS
jgi:hypothetical protein